MLYSVVFVSAVQQSGSAIHTHVCVLRHIQLFATPWTIACQAPLSLGFSRQGYWRGLPCSPLGDLPNLTSISSVSFIGRQILYHCTTWEALYMYIHPFFFGLSSHLGHHKALSKVTCAIQQVPISYLFHT